MKEIFMNPFLLSTLLGIVLLILPSPVVRTTEKKVGNAVEEKTREKARNIAYKILTDFAEGLKNSKYDGDTNLTSNDQIDRELDKYKISLGLMDSRSKDKY